MADTALKANTASRDSKAPAVNSLSAVILGIALVGLLAAPFMVYPIFLMKMLCFALFASAFNLLLGYTGILSFGHAAFFGGAAYITAHTVKVWGVTPELGLVLGVLAAAALGLVIGYLAIRRQGIYSTMITLALAQMFFFFCLQASFTHGEDGLQGVPRGYLFGIIDLNQPMTMYYFVLAVFVLGTGKYGRQWLDLKFFYLQPAELLKVSLPMMVAWYLHKMPLPPRFNTVLVSLVIIGVPTGLVMLQPDFGTGVLIAASGVFVLLLAGLPWWWVGLGVGGVAAVAPVAWFWLLRPYQKDRIMMFLDPEMDALGAGWNIIQSKIAIGSGGFDGKGWGEGSQSHLNFIPEQTTDFAFSVLSEEFGWIGVATVLALYLVVIGRCLWIASQSRDSYSRLLAGATGLAFFVYVLVNGGMISGLLPVVGVPMPLISYGGTSAVSLLAGFGLVMAVRSHNPVHGGYG